MSDFSRGLKQSFRKIERTVTTEWRKARLTSRRSEFKTVTRWSDGPAHPYFIMSDKGLYRADREGVHRILNIQMYGCAIVGAKVFMALYIGRDTILVEGDSKALFDSGTPFNFRPLFTELTNDTNERLHQVTAYDNGIWVARTANGAAMRYEIGSEKLKNYTLIRDRFGLPVKRDINHINSVVQYGDAILFTATHAGSQSMIGLMHGISVTGFGYKNTGVHDVYLTESGFLFFDTFGHDSGVSGGMPITEQGPIFPELFGKPPGFVPRGASQTGAEIVIGSSHKGARKIRFKGNGQLIVTENRVVRSVHTIPVAQIYQIINARGELLTPPSRPLNVETIKQMFERSLGKAIYEGDADVSEIAVGTEI